MLIILKGRTNTTHKISDIYSLVYSVSVFLSYDLFLPVAPTILWRHIFLFIILSFPLKIYLFLKAFLDQQCLPYQFIVVWMKEKFFSLCFGLNVLFLKQLIDWLNDQSSHCQFLSRFSQWGYSQTWSITIVATVTECLVAGCSLLVFPFIFPRIRAITREIGLRITCLK